MSKRVKQMPRWWIIRIKATPAVAIGSVDAPDAKSAVREAIKMYGITNPHHQQQLMAYRVS